MWTSHWICGSLRMENKRFSMRTNSIHCLWRQKSARRLWPPWLNFRRSFKHNGLHIRWRPLCLGKSRCLQRMHKQGAGTEDLVAVLVDVVTAKGGCAATTQEYDDYNSDDQRRIVLLSRSGGWGGGVGQIGRASCRERV